MILFNICLFLLGIGVQPENGSPVNWFKHWQAGECFITIHWALIPQDPGQGSLHFSAIHAKLLGHSSFIEHSGLQFGGRPIYCGKHEQAGVDPTIRHWEFGPHGEGEHGFRLTGTVSKYLI